MNRFLRWIGWSPPDPRRRHVLDDHIGCLVLLVFKDGERAKGYLYGLGAANCGMIDEILTVNLTAEPIDNLLQPLQSFVQRNVSEFACIEPFPRARAHQELLRNRLQW